MKKLLSLLLVVMFAFSTVLITACNNDNEQANTDNSEQSSSFEEESSSSRRRGEGAGTTSSNSTAGTSSEGNLPNSSTQSPTNSSTKPSTSYGDYDYNYTQSAVDPSEYNSPAGRLDKYIYLFVEDFPRPTLKGEFYPTLVSLEEQYNALSSVDKALVQNYSLLLEAREIYVRMAKEEAEKLIGDLPDATISNLTDFGTQASAIQKLLDNIGAQEANKISNINDYNQKVNKADSLLIDTFNAQVAELATFEYSDSYKAKMDYADEIYSLMSASQQSRVSQSKQALESKKTLYVNTGIVRAFEEKIFALPDKDDLNDNHKSTVLELKGEYGALTAEQQEILSSEAKAKFSELEKWFAGGRIAYIFHVMHTENEATKGQDSYVKKGWLAKNVPSEFIIDESHASFKSSADVHGMFEGVDYYQKGCDQLTSGGWVKITINSPTIFVMCINLKKENKTGTISVTRDDVAMPELTTNIVFSANGKNCEYQFDLVEAGTYVFTYTGDDSCRVFALAMY